MTRPDNHGGGEAAPPIAGDPSSFPADAELARTLVESTQRATLSTLTEDGYPYGSTVSYATTDEGEPVVLISEMAEHTVNARGDSRASVLIAAPVPEGDDPLGHARLTLVGRLVEMAEPGEVRDRYLAAHPGAAYYVDFTDFGFWRLQIERCRFVGGFGHMSWVDGPGYAAAAIDPLHEVAEGVVTHMNDDHADANLAYVHALAGLPEATGATMLGIDRYGVTLRAETPTGQRLARVPFAQPLDHADQARPAVIELLGVARAANDH
jgi:hypothetical protein